MAYVRVIPLFFCNLRFPLDASHLPMKQLILLFCLKNSQLINKLNLLRMSSIIHLLIGSLVKLFQARHSKRLLASLRDTVKCVTTTTVIPLSLAMCKVLLCIILLPLNHFTSGTGRPPEVEHSRVTVEPSSSGPTIKSDSKSLFDTLFAGP